MAGAATRIAVVGAGAMGSGIAQIFAFAGYPTRIYDVAQGAAAAAIARTDTLLADRAARGKIDAAELERFRASLSPATDLAELADADIVFEAVLEDLAVKRELFARLEAVVGADCVLATNTSSLLVTAIAAGLRHPERVLGAHFFNPVPLIRLVEIITTVHTAEPARERLMEAVTAAGHRAVAVTDSPGFLINHAGRGFYTEGARIVQEGVATHEDVDRVLERAAGFSMGPFRLLDLTGLDVSFAVTEKIYESFYQEPRFRPAPFLKLRVDAGLYGRKSGRGFYRYGDAAPEPDPAEASSGGAEALEAIHVPAATLDRFPWLATFLAGRPVRIATSPFGADEGLNLIAPVGTDATAAARAAGLPLGNTVAVDPVLPDPREVTLMANVATEPAWLDRAAALMMPADGGVTVIEDSPGFIVQRVIATIVNIACDIAQQRIAEPADIDAAVRIGLNYPMGPLAFGDRLGAGVICEILDALLARTGDPRYRASLWLRRRAEIGESLLFQRGGHER